MASTSRNLDIVIRVQDQATASLAKLQQQLAAFGKSVQQTAQQTASQVAAGAGGGGGTRGTVSASQAARMQAQVERQAGQERLQAQRVQGQLLVQAERQAAQERLQVQRQAVQQQQQDQRIAHQNQLAAKRQADAAMAQADRQAHATTLQAARQAGAVSLQQMRQHGQAQAQATRQAGQATSQANRQSHQTILQQDRHAFQERQRLARQAYQDQVRAQQAAARAQAAAARQNDVLSALRSVQAAYATLAAYIGGQFVQTLLRTASQMQDIRLSFNAMAGSVARGGQQFTFVRGLAQRFGLEITSLAQGYRQFVASTQGANLGLERQQRLFTIISATARIAGASADQLQRFITGLSQALDRGILEAEEFNQMQEAIPGVMNRVAAALNKNLNDLRLGKISTLEFVQGLEKALAGDVPKAADIAAASISGMTNRMINSWKDFLAALGNSSTIMGAMRSVLGIIQVTHDKLGELGLIAPRILEPIEKISEEIEQLKHDIATFTPSDLWSDTTLEEQKARLSELWLLRRKMRQEQAAADKERDATAPYRSEVEAVLATANAFNKAQEDSQRYYANLKTSGMGTLLLLEEQQQLQNKLLQDSQNQLKGVSEKQTILRNVLLAQVAARAKDVETTKAQIKAIQDKANADERAASKAITAAAEAKQRDLDARIALEAKRVGLEKDADAQRNFEDRVRAMTEEERNLYAATLPTTQALAAQNEALRKRNALRDLEKEGDKEIKRLTHQLRMMQDAVLAEREMAKAERDLALAKAEGTPEQLKKIKLLHEEITLQETLNDLKDTAGLYYKGAEQYGRMGAGEFPIPQGPTLEEERTEDYLRQADNLLVSIKAHQMALDPLAFEQWKISLQNLQPEQEATLKWLLDMEDQSRKTAAVWANVAQELHDFGQGLAGALEDSFMDLLNNTDDALHNLDEWLTKFGKSIIKLFGEEIIQLGLIPLKTALKQFAEELAKSEAIKKIVNLIVNIVSMAFGGGGGAPIPGMALTGGGGSVSPPVSVGAHGGIFGVQGMARGGLVSSPRLRLLGEATPEAVVPLTAEGIAKFTRGVTQSAGATPAAPSSREQEQRRWQETVDALAKRPVVIEVTLNNPIDPRRMGMQPEEVVQVVGKDINNDGVLRRVIMKTTQR